MALPALKTHPVLKALESRLVLLPTPRSLTHAWNWGSILGVCLGSQLITGVMLAIQYAPTVADAFTIVYTIRSDVNHGWLIRTLHANGARLFFLAIYLHVGRGLYFGSPRLANTWISGVILLFVLIAVAFLGYVLPWGQISFWGATVITNLLSAIPYWGEGIVYWLWGGFSVGEATLTRFFTLHFLLPFVLIGLVAGHLIRLHETGSSNPLGLNSNHDKLPFHPYFRSKDTVGWVLAFGGLTIVALLAPWVLGDTENFLIANPLVTPVHIKPEWYFLFAYAILRAIPNKLGGVLALVLSIAVLLLVPLIKPALTPRSPRQKLTFWGFVGVFLILTWVGGKPVEEPYVFISQSAGALYFTLVALHSLI